MREHPVAAYQGLRQIGGNWQYPIIEAFHCRTSGVGTRHRGGAAVIQVTTDEDYTKPTPEQIPV
jgi:hypothetical protein